MYSNPYGSEVNPMYQSTDAAAFHGSSVEARLQSSDPMEDRL